MYHAEIMGEIACPFCKQPLRLSNEIARCSICRTPHHLACWQEHRGCSVPNCEGKPAITRFSQKEKIPYLKILGPLLVILAAILIYILLK